MTKAMLSMCVNPRRLLLMDMELSVQEAMKAHLDNAQFYDCYAREWRDCPSPLWLLDCAYRLSPDTPCEDDDTTNNKETT